MNRFDASAPSFVIQYTGRDIPGIVNATSQCLRKHQFNITDVSTASGAEMQTFFITCQRQKDSKYPSNSALDRCRLTLLVSQVLQALYKRHDSDHEERVEVTVTTSIASLDIKFQLSLEIAYLDEIGLIADVTTLLRTHFTLDMMNVTDSPSEPFVGKGKPLVVLRAELSPSVSIENGKTILKGWSPEGFAEGLACLKQPRLGEQRDVKPLQKAAEDVGKYLADCWETPLEHVTRKDEDIKGLVFTLHNMLMLLNKDAKYDLLVTRIVLSFLTANTRPATLLAKGMKGSDRGGTPSGPGTYTFTISGTGQSDYTDDQCEELLRWAKPD